MEPLCPPSPRQNRLLAGGLMVLASALMFAGVGALVKAASADLPTAIIVFFRNAVAMVVFLPWLLSHRRSVSLKTDFLHLHLLRSAAALGAMYCYFASVRSLRLADAVLLYYTLPIFIAILEWLWLKEPVSRQIKIAIAVGFIGIVLVLKPGFGVFQPAGLLGLASGMLGALSTVGIRRMSVSEPVVRIVFYFAAFGTLMSSVPLTWSWQTPTAGLLLVLCAVGVLATAGQFFLTRGYSLAPANQLSPFSYGNVVFAILLGWVFWGESLDGLTLAGAMLTCVAGVIATYRTKPEKDSGA